jgi:hypothetical protein
MRSEARCSCTLFIASNFTCKLAGLRPVAWDRHCHILLCIQFRGVQLIGSISQEAWSPWCDKIWRITSPDNDELLLGPGARWSYLSALR